MSRGRVFETKGFLRWSRRERILEEALCAAVAELAAGLIDADLGGYVYKKRVPVAGRGKRGGIRVLVGAREGRHWFFLFGYRKNERATVDARELAALQALAKALLCLPSSALERAVAAGELTEICREEESRPS
jgi:hypothetical protein